MIVRLRDVLNYGGFFGGDTLTATAHAVDAPSIEQTLTIDQIALTNVSDRYMIVGGMALDLQFEGERVSAATLIGAQERAMLRKAIGENPKSQTPNPNTMDAPRIFSHHCPACDLWILGEPTDGKCGVEAHPLNF